MNTEKGQKLFKELLVLLGEDPERNGLTGTPERMVRAWEEWTSGYTVDASGMLTDFVLGYDEMVLEKDIPFFSHCEHHLAPFFGVVHVAYIPSRLSVIGISKLARIVDMYSKRLQIQERLTMQVATFIQTHIEPLGVAVVIEARHLCMESRGVKKQGQVTVTSAMKGVFKEKTSTRQEFLSLLK